MKKILLIGLTLILLAGCSPKENGNENLVKYALPLVGTDSEHAFSHGNVYPAIAVPWGMNFWSPQNGENGDGWAYTYKRDFMLAFKQTHQPSPWINDYGAFSIMPTLDKTHKPGVTRIPFSHENEVAEPNYYSVTLGNGIKTEITPTDRSVIFRITYPTGGEPYLVIDGFPGGSYIKVLPKAGKIVGYAQNNHGGVTENFANYFVIQAPYPFTETGVWDDTVYYDNEVARESFRVAATVKLALPTEVQEVEIKASSSFISEEQAWENFSQEVADKDFNSVKQLSQKRWNNVLSSIIINKGTEENKKKFYTFLYRSVLFPRKLHEKTKDGKIVHYSPYNGKILPGVLYTDNGFWDTFRGEFPLLCILYPKEVAEMLQGITVAPYKESGFLPEWSSPGHRDCMIGSNSSSIIANAYLNGITDFDYQTAYEGMLKSAYSEGPLNSVGRFGIASYLERGYVASDIGVNESTARTIEYAYNDYCIWKMAEALGRPKEEVNEFKERAMYYKNVFDPSVNFMRGRLKDGSFREPFRPDTWGGDFTEGSSWHWTWAVFHDPQGLIDLMGGKKNFVTLLDSVFVAEPTYDDSYYGFPIHEIKEMVALNMGQYAHGNQPIQHMIYLYNYVGQPWKTQKWIRHVLDSLYSATPDGYCGDEDNGQTSAWFVMSSLGFYSVCPGSGEYVLAAPLFEEATINLEAGKKFVIKAHNLSDKNIYVQSIKLNGQPYSKLFITHDDITQGGIIEFEMTDTPNTEIQVAQSDLPYSLSNELKTN